MVTEISPHPATYPAGFPAVDVVGRATALRLFVLGRPAPKGRPRGRVVNPHGAKPFVTFYTDEATQKWEAWVVHEVDKQLRQLDCVLPLTGRTLVTLRFNLERPKSIPITVKFPVKNRTDVDNLAKAVLDALQNCHVLSNDCIVTDLAISKRYADSEHPEGVEIDITGLS